MQPDPDQPHTPATPDETPAVHHEPETHVAPAPAEHHVDPPVTPDPPPAPAPVPEHAAAPAAQHPVAAAAATVTMPGAPAPDAPQPANAARLILEWLTYAFWGWTVLGMSWLTYLVVSSLMANADVGDFTPYGIAAVLVLLPVSFVCDMFYTKQEPAKKAGAELAIMAIHAVIFALFGIGSLITAVFCIVQMLTSRADQVDTMAVLITSIIITAYYGVTFIRTLNPKGTSFLPKIYRFFMLITIGIIVVLAIIGPVAKQRTLRNDQLIDAGLSSVSTAVNSYASKNDHLPDSLKDVDVRDDAKTLVDSGLITYKQDSPKSTATPTPTGTPLVTGYTVSPNGTKTYTTATATPSTSYNSRITMRYQLCVTYTAADTHEARSTTLSSKGDSYSSYPDTYGHAKGNVCYKLETESY